MTAAHPSYIERVFSETDWQRARHAHEERLRPLLDPYLERRSRGEKDPVMDFLFTYYSFRPGRLLRWTAGLGTALEGETARTVLDSPEFVETPAGWALDPSRFPAHRQESVRWIHAVLEQTEHRPAFLGCHGLHEWAMVYRTRAVRHAQVPLRMQPDDLAAFVESRPLICSHFDAFRFFSPAARPLNRHQPTRATMPALEQPGCLHTNMDLYRWAYKLYPWTPSSLLADTFLLACRIREVDMRASPYDLRGFGLEPICIETAEGRRTYAALQHELAQEAAPLRTALRGIYERLLAHL